MSRFKINELANQTRELIKYTDHPKWDLMMTLVAENCEDNIDVNTCCNIGKHMIYYERVFSGATLCARYIDFDKAMMYSLNKIMIRIPEINVYCIFENLHNVKSFLANVYNYIHKIGINNDSDDIIVTLTFTPQQIIPANQSQKPVFYVTFENANYIEDFKERCVKYFTTSINMQKIGDHYEVTVDITLSNLDEVVEAINGFKNELNMFKKYTSSDKRINKIKITLPVSERTDLGKLYTAYDVSHHNWNGDVYDTTLLKHIPNSFNEKQIVIKTIHNVTYINNSNINNGKNIVNGKNIKNGIIKNNNNNQDIRELKVNEAKKWINLHLPEDGVRTKLYYDNYKQSIIHDIPIDQGTFNDYVVSLGYKNIKTNKYHLWKKNEI